MSVLTAVTPLVAAPTLDVEKPGKERRRQLRCLIDANINDKNPPLKRVRLQSLGELLWILLIHQWSGGIISNREISWIKQVDWFITSRSRKNPEKLGLADLRGVNLRGVDLTAVDLDGADLQDGDLRQATLRAASIKVANLVGTLLTDADLTETQLIDTGRAKELQEERRLIPPFYAGIEIRTRNELLWIFEQELWTGAPVKGSRSRPDLREANLIHIDFSGQDLIGVNFSGATLLDEHDERRLQPSKTGNGPYFGTSIQTRSELLWIMRQNNWSCDPRLPKGCTRPNLSGANMHSGQFQGCDLAHANLRRARLDSANFSGARMGKADLRGVRAPFAVFHSAELRGARLDGAKLSLTDFEAAELFGAHCSGAQIVGARLFHSNMSVADLRGADCREADLRAVDLRGARVDAATSLIDVSLDTFTKLGDVVWYGVPLTQIRWNQAPILGDERDIANSEGEDRTKSFKNATRAYRGLWIALRQQGIYDAASRYRLRQKRLERQAKREQGGINGWFEWVSSLRSDLVTGYGEEPWKALVAFATVVLLYGLVYFGLTNFNLPGVLSVRGHQLDLIGALLFSLTIFQGRAQAMGTTLAVISATETILGGYILLAFTVLNTQRLLGRS